MAIFLSIILDGINWIATLLLLYFTIRNSIILRNVFVQYTIATGVFLFNMVGMIFLLNHFTAESTMFQLLASILFTLGTILITYSILYSAIIVSRSYNINLLRLIRIIPYEAYRFAGLFIILSLSLFYIKEGIGSADLLIQLSILIAFTLFIIAEIKLYLGARKHSTLTLNGDNIGLLLRDDIIIASNYITLIDAFLSVIKVKVGYRLLKSMIDNFTEENPLIFESIDIENSSTATGILMKNLDRIYDQDRVNIIYSVFSHLVLKIINLYSTITSPNYTQEVLEESYALVKDALRDESIVLEMLNRFPIHILEDERLSLLSKEELEKRVRARTVELETEKKLSDDIIATIPDSLIILNKDLRIISANQNFYKTFNTNQEEIKDKLITDVLSDNSKDTNLRNKFSEIKKGITKPFELQYRSGTSGARIFEVTNKGIPMEEKHRTLIILKDVTDKKLEEQKEIQTGKIRTLEQLAPWLAHQLKNPLAIILGYTQLISHNSKIKKIKDSNILENLTAIETQVNRASNLVTNLLSFASHKEIEFRRLSINSVLDRAMALHQPLFDRHNIILKKKAKNSFLEMEGDEDQLMEVFTVIINNSIESMAKGGVLEFSISKKSEKPHIEVIIKDNGCGIEKKQLDKLFTPFFTTKESGTGLGLFFSKLIISNHSGNINIKSTVEEGTEVIVRLPLASNE